MIATIGQCKLELIFFKPFVLMAKECFKEIRAENGFKNQTIVCENLRNIITNVSDIFKIRYI